MQNKYFYLIWNSRLLIITGRLFSLNLSLMNLVTIWMAFEAMNISTFRCQFCCRENWHHSQLGLAVSWLLRSMLLLSLLGYLQPSWQCWPLGNVWSSWLPGSTVPTSPFRQCQFWHLVSQSLLLVFSKWLRYLLTRVDHRWLSWGRIRAEALWVKSLRSSWCWLK